MGAFAVTLESDTPPQISVGQKIGGATVKELKALDQKLVSASELAEKYSIFIDFLKFHYLFSLFVFIVFCNIKHPNYYKHNKNN